MYKEEIREKLEGLRDELGETQEEYEEVTDEIEELSWQLDNLENDQHRLEKKESELLKEIQELEKQLMDKEFEELDNVLTGNKFRDAFIKCSWFCRKHEDTSAPLTYVKITGKRLMATDGYRGIVVECDSIPDELKNTFIKWNIRDNFKDNTKTEHWKIFDLEKVIKEGKSDIEIKLRQDEFLKKLHYKNIKQGNYKRVGEITILNFNNNKVAFNKEYLNIALMAFKGMDITVYYSRSKYSPMIMENEEQTVILLPIRLNPQDY